MNKIFSISIMATSTLLILCSIGLAKSASTLPLIRTIDAIQAVPGNGFQMVESAGRVFFVTQNGRYVIKGDMYDMWSGGARVTSVANLKTSSSRIDLDQIGVKMEDLFSMSYGSGPKDVTVFVSPGCPYCKQTMQEMTTGDLAEKYTFNIVPIPLLGTNSQISVKKLVAAANSNPNETLNALMTDDYSALNKTEGGNIEGVKRAMVTAKIIGINEVPVLLSEDGHVQKGAPKSLASWLEGVN